MNSGDMATVQCAVPKGDFPIKFSWFHDNKTIDDSRILISKINKRISTLSIDSVRAENTGEYTCTARNLAGGASYAASLNVNGIVL